MATRWSSLPAVLVLGCGPSAADGEGGGDGSSIDASGVTSSTADDGAAETGTASSSATTSTSEIETSSDEECLSGEWSGHYTLAGEISEFQSCGGGDPWWFDPPLDACEVMPVRIDVVGELCGPGAYGDLGSWSYELRGEIVSSPCFAKCDEFTEWYQCAEFRELCPYLECDIVEQDCAGTTEKCIPDAYPLDEPPWIGSQCVEPREPPSLEGSECESVSPWVYPCVEGTFCAVDESGTGLCVPVCDPNTPSCDGGTTCWACDVAPESKLAPFGVCAAEPTPC